MATVVLNARTYTLPDLSCTSVKAAFSDPSYSGYTAQSCSTDPVAVGTTVSIRNVYASPPYVNLTVSSASSAATTPTAPEAFDYAYASAIWSLAFTSVVGLYLVAKNVGLILALIRGR